MPKSPAQSDFVYESPHVDHEADLAAHGAGKRITRGVYIVMGVLLVVLFVLVAIALHVPSGESP